MIGKIVKGRSFKGCISYVLSDKEVKILASEGVLETDTKSIINSFYMQSLLNPNLSKCVGHIPLAFSPEDTPRMTDNFMKRLAKEYMQEMGIKNTQYLIARHKNTNHPHLHIVFNRVDNDGKTISDKNDRYRNEQVCKQLKDKYNLTYGRGKENVNIEKLKGAEQTKYEIYHAVKSVLSKAKSWKQFEEALKQQSISIEYKYKGQTDEVQGISFKKGDRSFKGSDVDRKFSYGKLSQQLGENSNNRKGKNPNGKKLNGNSKRINKNRFNGENNKRIDSSNLNQLNSRPLPRKKLVTALQKISLRAWAMHCLRLAVCSIFNPRMKRKNNPNNHTDGKLRRKKAEVSAHRNRGTEAILSI